MLPQERGIGAGHSSGVLIGPGPSAVSAESSLLHHWGIPTGAWFRLQGRSPGEGQGYPLQYSGLENSMDCIVRGVAKRQT